MTDDVVEVDVNCAEQHTELFPSVLSAIRRSTEIVRLLGDGRFELWNWLAVVVLGSGRVFSLDTLAVDLRAFTPGDMSMVKQVLERSFPYLAHRGADPQAFQWLRAPSLHHDPIAAVIPQTNDRTEPITVLLPRGVVQVNWTDDMEVLDEVPTPRSSARVRNIQITSMTQQSATPAVELLQLIGTTTTDLSVRHSLFRGPHGDDKLLDWWKAVFAGCPSIDSVTYDEISMAQASVLVRAASSVNHPLRVLRLNVRDGTGLADFLSLIGPQQHLSESLTKLTIYLGPLSMAECQRWHKCDGQQDDEDQGPPLSRYDVAEIAHIHRECVDAFKAFYSSFSSEHQLWDIQVDMATDAMCDSCFDELLGPMRSLQDTKMPVIWRGRSTSKRAFMGLLSVLRHNSRNVPATALASVLQFLDHRCRRQIAISVVSMHGVFGPQRGDGEDDTLWYTSDEPLDRFDSP